MSEELLSVKRPALIWLTQALLVLYFVIVSVAVASTIPTLLAIETFAGRVLGTLFWVSCVLALAGPLCVLFYGLARRRRWAWRGSLVFAICVLILLAVSQLARPTGPSNGPFPQFEIKPEQQLGATIARITIPLLTLIYTIRLYFSSKVRAFLGVAQRTQHGR